VVLAHVRDGISSSIERHGVVFAETYGPLSQSFSFGSFFFAVFIQSFALFQT
jgi:hypothetical protein